VLSNSAVGNLDGASAPQRADHSARQHHHGGEETPQYNAHEYTNGPYSLESLARSRGR